MEKKNAALNLELSWLPYFPQKNLDRINFNFVVFVTPYDICMYSKTGMTIGDTDLPFINWDQMFDHVDVTKLETRQ